MDITVLCVLLIIFAAMWLIGELFPRTALVARIGRILWVIVATLTMCGVRIEG